MTSDNPLPAAPIGAANPRPKIREALLLLAAVLAAGLPHFVVPERSRHIYSTHVAGPVSYAFNPDSPHAARIVLKFPSGFVDSPQTEAYRMRPLYDCIGWGIYQPLRLLRPAVPQRFGAVAEAMMARANHPELWAGIDGRDLVLAWAALIIVNLLIYWAALILVFRALAAIFERHTALLLSIAPLAHPDVMDYVFVPHTEPLDLLIPAVFLYTAVTAWSQGRTGRIAALAMGVLMLGKQIAYPALNWAYAALRSPRRMRALAMVAFLIAIPTLLFFLLLRILSIPPAYPEIDRFREVIWIQDYWQEGRVAEIPVRLVKNVGEHMVNAAGSFAGLLLVTACLLLKSRRRESPAVPPGLWRHIALYAIAGISFWSLLGLLDAHRALTHFPVIIVPLGVLAVSRSLHPNRWIMGGVLFSVAAHIAVRALAG